MCQLCRSLEVTADRLILHLHGGPDCIGPFSFGRRRLAPDIFSVPVYEPLRSATLALGREFTIITPQPVRMADYQRRLCSTEATAEDGVFVVTVDYDYKGTH
jgi:hypothetical protein